jgi:hypothetical protein
VGGQERQARRDLREPLLRTSKMPETDERGSAGSHPLDEAIRIAENALRQIRDEIDDYKCVMVKRERVNGRLGEHEFMFARIRNRKLVDGKIKVPFAVYLYFTKPESLKGRECAYVEGANDGKLAVKEPGIAGKLLPIIWLAPDSVLAMRGNLYPITDAGIENLIVKLLEKGTRDRKRDECEVQFRENAKVNDRRCQLMEVIHPNRRAYFDFNLAHIYIDNETGLPIRYAAYTWPKGRDQNPEPRPSDDTLIEEYTYLDLKLNPGLTDRDFELQ